MLLGLAGPPSGLTRDVFAAVRRLVAAALQVLWTGQSFLAVFFLSFFLIGKQEVCFSWQLPSIWNYPLLPLGGSTESTAAGLSRKGLVLNDRAAQHGLPPP